MDLKQGKRECEMKYRIKNKEEENIFIEKIEKLGFQFKCENLESDYTPDVPNFLCRENGLMLRFRVFEGNTNDVLITLKIKGVGRKFQDNYEIETSFNEFDIEKFNEINDKLFEATKCKVPLEIRNFNNINSIRKYLSNNSFSEHRMFTQKKRREYMDNQGKKITLDEFPKDIGKFLEIETVTPEELFETIEKIGLSEDNLEKRNYGEIIKEKQKELPESQRRTCIFDD